MPRPRFRRLAYAILGALALAAVVWGFLPAPVSVETSVIGRGPLEVTADEDGETRSHDRYMISAPVAGRISRIELHEGDPVRAGQAVALLWPVPLSARERDEQRARIAAAEAAVREAREGVRHAAADYDQAKRERLRADHMVKEGFISPQGAEQAHVREATGANDLEAARFRLHSAQADLDVARAALPALEEAHGKAPAAIPVRSPVDGKVLRIVDKSGRVVAAGTPLLSVGDPARLEVVIDLLSTEAVNVKPGMAVRLERWGGGRPLLAKVRLVEPQAFTKVSALGVEEQRVNVIADFVDPPGPLGDGYRVEARVVLWQGEDVLKVPVSALFRYGEDWSVFVVADGRVHRRIVALGHRGILAAEVTKGLQPGERVVRYPSNDIADGERVKWVDSQ